MPGIFPVTRLVHPIHWSPRIHPRVRWQCFTTLNAKARQCPSLLHQGHRSNFLERMHALAACISADVAMSTRTCDYEASRGSIYWAAVMAARHVLPRLRAVRAQCSSLWVALAISSSRECCCCCMMVILSNNTNK
jgi:hypothetical protein